MRAHLNRCPNRGRPFAERTPGSRSVSCTCFAELPVKAAIDPGIDWDRNVNVYVTYVTRRFGGESARLRAHDIGSVPGTANFGRRRALEILVRDEPSVQLWVTNNVDRAHELAARHPTTREVLAARNKGIPTKPTGEFPLVSANRGGIRYRMTREVAALPPGHHTVTLADAHVDPETGVTEALLDSTAASRGRFTGTNVVVQMAAADVLIASGGWCAPADAAKALGLTPPKPKADPEAFQWRKTASAQGAVYGKLHAVAHSGDLLVALCTAANNEPVQVGSREPDGVIHEGRCKRCLNYINAPGGAVPPDWPRTTEIRAIKKENEMDRSTRAARLREEAERLLMAASDIESRPAAPEPDEDGTATVAIRVRFRPEDTRTYDYAAVLATNGLWYATGGAFGESGITWERLTDYFFDNCAEVTVWHASEFVVIGEKSP